jgi:hypothetical protein
MAPFCNQDELIDECIEGISQKKNKENKWAY